ncbi:hypothetical protein DM02DRAFT_636016 [Periconia macrospinosa]|uniref:Uncharacterized protein n=1 Tax=Periconia macrospinosa TaxID=97972 RepID=A0A2V1D2Y9_9PLEO|nr:hypothetical protein DM02DRAFT_636016 [Periconia macrospinosa]
MPYWKYENPWFMVAIGGIDDEVDQLKAEKGLIELDVWVANDDSSEPAWLDSMDGYDGAPEWLKPLQSQGNITYAVGILGALLKKWVPTAGLSHLPLFLALNLHHDNATIQRLRGNFMKKFWKRAAHTVGVRRRSEEKRRAVYEA